MSRHRITLRFLAEPTDVNFGGKVFGGSVMKWIDHAGFTCAANWSGNYCVTAYVGGIQFLQPIHVGDLVELDAEVMHTGNTSVHISVSVYARDPTKKSESRFTTHCILVFVAVDSDGRPIPVPAYTPSTECERHLNNYACKMIDLRKDMQNEVDAFMEELQKQGRANE